MTAKRDSKSTPKKDERPKLEREKIRDLDAERTAGGVKGGLGTKRDCYQGNNHNEVVVRKRRDV